MQLKAQIETHNKELASMNPVPPEAKAIITTNLQFLAQIEKKVAVLNVAAPSVEGGKRYFSWVDSLLSAVIGFATFAFGIIFLYNFLSKKQPELFPSLIAAIKSFGNKQPNNDA